MGVFRYISSVKKKTNVKMTTRPWWRMIVDGFSGLKKSNCFATKNGMVEPKCEFLHKLWENGFPVKKLRMDGAGENKTLEKQLNGSKWQMAVNVEWTPRDTPQFNAKVEVGFATIANQGRVVMAAAHVPEQQRYQFYPEAFKFVTQVDGFGVVEINRETKTRYEHAGQPIPRWSKHLRTWGEVGTVMTKDKKMPTKVGDCGVQMVFMGYPDDTSSNAYRMWNPGTNQIIVSRDVVWLKRMYFSTPETAPPAQAELPSAPSGGESVAHARSRGELIASGGESRGEREVEAADDDDNNDDDDGMPQLVNRTDDDDDSDDEDEPTTTRSGRAVRAPDRLIENMAATIELSPAENAYYAEMQELNAYASVGGTEYAMVGAAAGGGFIDTHELHVMKYDQAMATNEKEEWKKSVKDEHDRFEKGKVFKAVPKGEVPEDAKILTSTWAMKKKSNGTYRARLNARGFEQVPGEHYDDTRKSSPVVAEITIMVILNLILIFGWYAEVLDVKGAFLTGDFLWGETIYMEVPQGFEEYYPPDVVLLLLKTIYRLVQSAMAYWTKLCQAFVAIAFERSKADPCLWYKWTENGLVIFIAWIDDMIVAGKPESVQGAKEMMKTQFECEELGELNEYVGTKIDHDKADRSMKLTQPVLLQSFEDEFDMPKEKWSMPAAPNSVLVDVPAQEVLPPVEHKEYRKMVGKLLHMKKKSRPDVSNPVRESTRFASKPKTAHMNFVRRIVQYLIGTPNRGTTIKPTKLYDGTIDFGIDILGRSDSDYSKNPETRKSVSGWSVFMNGGLVTAKSKGQPTVSLSVTESETNAGAS